LSLSDSSIINVKTSIITEEMFMISMAENSNNTCSIKEATFTVDLSLSKCYGRTIALKSPSGNDNEP
jgi:hypothetical protein